MAEHQNRDLTPSPAVMMMNKAMTYGHTALWDLVYITYNN